MKDNFDLHNWNKKRYLGELEIDQEDDNINQDNEDGSLNVTRGGDDPKIGAELEAGVVGDRVAENQSHLEFLAKYLNSMYPELTWEVRFGERIDAYGSQSDLFKFGNKYHGKKFGDYEVFHVDDDDRLDIVRIVKSSKLREDINEASYMYKGYKDKHFDICPAAEALRDRLLAGEFKDNSWATGTDFEKEVGEWLYQNDVIFGIEKKIIKDKEGDESDIAKAKEAEGRVVNLSRDLGIPASEINAYLPAHIKTIKDMVEYSSLTEKDDFAGSDPKAGSTIKGTGFMAPRQKPKVTQRDIDDIEASGNIDIAYNKAMDLLKSMTEREAVKETLRFIKENNPEFTNEEIKAELKEIKELGSQLDEEKSKLCKRGRDYIAARKRAGEKSSAYLSGRGVKVCKGQIKGTKGKKRKDYKG